MGQADRYPALEIKDSLIRVLKEDTYISTLVNNISLNEPIVYKTAIENLTMYDCPAIGVFLPTELNFKKENLYKNEPSLFFIDVVCEDSDYIESQNKALKLCYDIKSIIECKSNLYNTVANLQVYKFQELGSFNKNKIFQFAYRIHIEILSS